MMLHPTGPVVVMAWCLIIRNNFSEHHLSFVLKREIDFWSTLGGRLAVLRCAQNPATGHSLMNDDGIFTGRPERAGQECCFLAM